MAQLLVLTGGDEFHSTCIESDLVALNFFQTKEKLVRSLPTAAKYQSSGEKAYSNAKRYFGTMGFSSDCIDIYSKSEANDALRVKKLIGVRHVYIVGGNPVYLLQTLKNTLFVEKLRDWLNRCNVLFGSSAGAMVLGSYMRNPIDKTWIEGLGIIPGVAVLPHHENSDPNQTLRNISNAGLEDIIVLGIDGKTSCLGNGSSWKVMGPGAVTVYNRGNWKVFQSGEDITKVG